MQRLDPVVSHDPKGIVTLIVRQEKDDIGPDRLGDCQTHTAKTDPDQKAVCTDPVLSSVKHDIASYE